MISPNAFIAEYIDLPFRRGTDDCSLWLADWWKRVHGTDPASHLRGTYATKDEQEAIINAAGGLVSLVASIAEPAGAVVRPMDYQAGDIAVIAPGVGAIYTGTWWAFRTETGVGFTKSARVWRAWSVGA